MAAVYKKGKKGVKQFNIYKTGEDIVCYEIVVDNEECHDGTKLHFFGVKNSEAAIVCNGNKEAHRHVIKACGSPGYQVTYQHDGEEIRIVMKNEWKVYDYEGEEVASGPYLICERDQFVRLKVSKRYD